jgi:hypothetical protein
MSNEIAHRRADGKAKRRWVSAVNASRVGALVSVSSLVLVVVMAASADAGSSPQHATEAERASIRRAFAEKEQKWRNEARAAFPGDLWSQDDDYQRREVDLARDLANRLRVPFADVLDALDEGLRVPPFPGEVRRATVHACKPRPFYD